jgi:hypothetical protein
MQSGVSTNRSSLLKDTMADKGGVGIDLVSMLLKGWLDVAFAEACNVARIADDSASIKAWLASVGPSNIGLVAFEPTGGYERTHRHALQRAGSARQGRTRRRHEKNGRNPQCRRPRSPILEIRSHLTANRVYQRRSTACASGARG